MTKLYLKILSFIFIFLFMLGCSQNANNQNTQDTQDEMSSSNERSNEMPTNQINAWTDGCEIAMEFARDNTIWALDSKTIKYSKINDSVFEIIYPKEPTIIKNIDIQTIGNLKYVSFHKSLGNRINNEQNEIYFGADRLKFQTISKESIKVFYPSKSIWKIARISNSEIYIYNSSNKTRYQQFLD